MIIALLLLQTAQPAPATEQAAQPDIQLDIRATARRVVIENKGEVELTLYTAVNGVPGENNLIQVNAPDLPEGRRELNNVDVRVRAEARISPPQNAPKPQEPAAPQ